MEERETDITLLDVLNGKIDASELSFMFKYGQFNAVNHLGLKPLMSQSFGLVKDLQTLHRKGLGILEFVDTLDENKIMDIKVLRDTNIFKIHETILHTHKDLNSIAKLEADNLSSVITNEEKEADIDRFAVFGVLMQFRTLSNNRGELWDEIRNWDYMKCFSILRMNFEINDYKEDLTRIRNRKNRRK